MAKPAFALAWFSLLCAAGPSAAGELTSASFRLRGANLNGGSQAALQSTAPSPRFAASGVALGQSGALGFSGSGASLTSAAPGFWPIAAGEFPNLDLDGDGLQAFADPDDDNDGLLDVVESNTGTFVSAQDTGTDPLDPDSDADGFSDGVEVAAGTDPTEPGSNPGVSPAVAAPSLHGLGPLALLASALLATALARLGRAGRRR